MCVGHSWVTRNSKPPTRRFTIPLPGLRFVFNSKPPTRRFTKSSDDVVDATYSKPPTRRFTTVAARVQRRSYSKPPTRRFTRVLGLNLVEKSKAYPQKEWESLLLSSAGYANDFIEQLFLPENRRFAAKGPTCAAIGTAQARYSESPPAQPPLF